MKTIITKTTLPIFNGFYGTFFECDCEDAYIEDGKTYEDYNWDYRDYEKRVSNECIGKVQDKLKELGYEMKIAFDGVYSPREYNFRNDAINVTITFEYEVLKRMRKYAHDNKEAFAEHLEEHHKSRSGFSSFYDHEPDTWFNHYLIDTDSDEFVIALWSLLQFILVHNDYTHDVLANECNEINSIDCELIEN